jgi:spermidine synthase
VVERASVDQDRILLVNVLVVAVCALVYELLCGTLASYLLGDAVLQFSLVLGTYVFAMGAGAWISRRFEPRAGARFVQTELGLALVGGFAVPALLLGFGAHLPLRPLLHAIVFVIGALVGLELPLLVRLLRDRHAERAKLPTDEAKDGPPKDAFAEIVARAFAYDYVGALAASLLFPLVLVPRLGLVRTGVVAGVVNVLVALSATFVVRLDRPRRIRTAAIAAVALLAVAFFRAEGWVAGATD